MLKKNKISSISMSKKSEIRFLAEREPCLLKAYQEWNDCTTTRIELIQSIEELPPEKRTIPSTTVDRTSRFQVRNPLQLNLHRCSLGHVYSSGHLPQPQPSPRQMHFDVKFFSKMFLVLEVISYKTSHVLSITFRDMSCQFH